MYKIEYGEKSVKIFKNVSPFTGGNPLWDIFCEVFTANEIPQSIISYLSEDEIDKVFWFFEDIS